MTNRFARRISELRASDIRELLKHTQHPEMISLAGGLPAPETFPIEAIATIAGHVLQETGAQALQYSTTEGHPPLRQTIARRMNSKWGTQLDANNILVTTGSQQGLDLIGKLFLDDGDEVLCESPTYMGAITAWKVQRPRWVDVPTDDEGMIPSELEQCLARCRRPKFIYVIPNFQNPTGRTWSRERRERVVEIAKRWDVTLIEDNPYGEVRFDGESLPALQSLDAQANVLSLGTFSKVFSPGLRLGWIAARDPYYEKLVILKQGADLHTSTLDQMLVAEWLERYDLDATIRRIVDIYRKRRDAMIQALSAEMPDGVTFTRPCGGLFLWVELPVNARVLLARCLERGVAFVPGGSFFPNGGRENTLRLNFSCMPEPRIREGIARMGAAIRELIVERDIDCTGSDRELQRALV